MIVLLKPVKYLGCGRNRRLDVKTCNKSDLLHHVEVKGICHANVEQIIFSLYGNTEKFSADKLLVLGGGGYNMNVVVRSWTMLLAKLLNVEIDDTLPQSWLDFLNSKWTELPPPEQLRYRKLRMESLRLKDPYRFDDLEQYYQKIIEKFNDDLIPAINSDI